MPRPPSSDFPSTGGFPPSQMPFSSSLILSPPGQGRTPFCCTGPVRRSADCPPLVPFFFPSLSPLSTLTLLLFCHSVSPPRSQEPFGGGSVPIRRRCNHVPIIQCSSTIPNVCACWNRPSCLVRAVFGMLCIRPQPLFTCFILVFGFLHISLSFLHFDLLSDSLLCFFP